jgi:hypothetical protein
MTTIARKCPKSLNNVLLEIKEDFFLYWQPTIREWETYNTD